ncbi:pyridoxamine 5'-phosphate oxidase family protein [Streptomyces sp. NPDC090306]|uniref:pyridoxamine 5'-phosphate oxidase family protein n=1 Tax=Streptomyces sp. NPDC090306 TaxID=3365961 RepID=UPI0038200B6C
MTISDPTPPPADATTDRTADAQLALRLLGLVDRGQVATSRRALPYLAAARHVVVDGRLVLRMHRGHDHHRSCVGSIVAYGADEPGSDGEAAGARGGGGRGPVRWSVQVVGECAAVEPTAAELERFGPPPPPLADDEPFDPVYVCVTPEFVTVRTAG